MEWDSLKFPGWAIVIWEVLRLALDIMGALPFISGFWEGDNLVAKSWSLVFADPSHLSILVLALGLSLILISKLMRRETGIETVHDGTDDPTSPTATSSLITRGDTEHMEAVTSTSLNDLDKPDYEEQDWKDEWPIYQLAYLWYDRQYPRRTEWKKKMPIQVEDKWDELRLAVNKGDLSPSGIRNGRVYISRDEIRRYAYEQGENPPFLFPEERE